MIEGRQVSSIRSGSIIHARVVESRGNGSYLVDVSGKLLIARSYVPLQSGRNVKLYVKETKPYLMVNLMGEEEAYNIEDILKLIAQKYRLGNTKAIYKALTSMGRVVPELMDNLIYIASKIPLNSYIFNTIANHHNLIEELFWRLKKLFAKQKLPFSDYIKERKLNLKDNVVDIINDMVKGSDKMTNVSDETIVKQELLEAYLKLANIRLKWFYFDDGAGVLKYTTNDSNKHITIALFLSNTGNIRIDINEAMHTILMYFDSNDVREKMKVIFLKDTRSRNAISSMGYIVKFLKASSPLFMNVFANMDIANFNFSIRI